LLQQTNIKRDKKDYKTYSYDHLEVWREQSILRSIMKYQAIPGS